MAKPGSTNSQLSSHKSSEGISSAVFLSLFSSALLFLLISLFTATVAAEEPTAEYKSTDLKAVKPYSIQYKVMHDGDKIGTAKRTLEQLSNGQWQSSMKSDISYYLLSDERRETSRFEIVDGVIRPLHYQSFADTSFRSDRTLTQKFDWDAMREQGSYEDRKWNMQLQDGLLDPLTEVLAVRETLMAQKPLQAIDISYRGGIRHHEFTVMGEETLKLKSGDIRTAKLQLVEKDGTRITNFWFAIDHEMLLVQIQRIKDDEEEAKLVATSWKL
ncbi:DUF3108 domain-containing protein [Kangiella sp.]|uniref:DUF3108 domain-containing protein n=1 Tax=Kangiella sp. TaxID=1920245 RepID=UPI003A959683